MQRKERNYKRHLKTEIPILFVIFFFLIASNCTAYNPSVFQGYDILSPGEEVTNNPLGWTEDGNVIVNEAFILWVYELQEEIRKLRDMMGVL